MATGPAPQATVVITTKNRRDELRTAIRSCLIQTAAPEVLVIDDGSTDGTGEMVRSEFPGVPGVRLVRDETSRGYIVQRNRAAELACGPILFSIDDDAAFSSPRVVEQVLREFDAERVGAVAIPYTDVNRANAAYGADLPADGRRYAVASYVGTSHAVRRDVFLRLGGYRASLVHQGEESDFCLRMLDTGRVVVAARTDPILHYESPRRDFRRMDYFGHRNNLLLAWHHAPWPAVLPHLLGATALGVAWGVKQRRSFQTARGLLAGYGAILAAPTDRRPVSRRAYRAYRFLRRRGVAPLDELEPLLPPLT